MEAYAVIKGKVTKVYTHEQYGKSCQVEVPVVNADSRYRYTRVMAKLPPELDAAEGDTAEVIVYDHYDRDTKRSYHGCKRVTMLVKGAVDA